MAVIGTGVKTYRFGDEYATQTRHVQGMRITKRMRVVEKVGAEVRKAGCKQGVGRPGWGGVSHSGREEVRVRREGRGVRGRLAETSKLP